MSCECQPLDRKSTRLNSSHSQISYAVFCLKKKIDVGAGAEEELAARLEVLQGVGRRRAEAVGDDSAGLPLHHRPAPFFPNLAPAAEISTLSLHDALPI